MPASGNCGFAGIALDEAGNVYVSDGAAATIYLALHPKRQESAYRRVFATGVPGTNGLAFDRRGNLWTVDGTTGQGRVWKISSPGANCASAPCY